MSGSQIRLALSAIVATLVIAMIAGGVFYFVDTAHLLPGSGGTPTPSSQESDDAGSSGGPFPIFRAAGTMSRARLHPSAVVLADGRVLVVGGEAPGAADSATPIAEIYDPGTAQFSDIGPMKTARYGAAVALLRDGRVLVAGGSDGAQSLTSAEIYDPASGQFRIAGSLAFAVDYGTAVTLADGRVLIAGGADGNALVQLFDPDKGTFSAAGILNVKRTGFSATLLQNGRVLIAGGAMAADSGDSRELASAELYDPGSGSSVSTGSMAAPRYAPVATLLPSGKVLVLGEGDAESELYDPDQGTFTKTGKMVEARSGCSATLLADGRVLIAGGQEPTRAGDPENTRVLGSTEIYNPRTGKFRAGEPMPIARSDHAAVLLKNGSVLLLGGLGGPKEDLVIADAAIQSSAIVASSQ